MFRDIKIVAFPFAGGNKYSFNPIKNKITQNRFEVFEYSGRGTRVSDNLRYNIDDIVDEAVNFVKGIAEKEDYTIYGHSMGALIGYLCCKKIEKEKLQKPLKLVVSGNKAPSCTRDEILYELPDDRFLKKVITLGGIPKGIMNFSEFLEYYIPILKADFQCVENYQYDKNAPKLTIPIDVFYGSDEEITQLEAEAWQEETTANVNVTELNGNHFFIFNHKEFFIEYFKNLQLNAFIERFNGSYRRGVLNKYIFENLDQVREQTKIWIDDYNNVRPHDALSKMSPVKYAQKQRDAAAGLILK